VGAVDRSDKPLADALGAVAGRDENVLE